MSTDLLPFRVAFNHMWNDIGTELGKAFGDMGRAGMAPRSVVFRPVLNMVETETDYVLTLELPGSSLEEITIELKGADLVVFGDRRDVTAETEGKWHCVESRCGHFSRTVRLGVSVNSDGIDAEYRDGILRITVPKSEDRKPRRIEIRS